MAMFWSAAGKKRCGAHSHSYDGVLPEPAAGTHAAEAFAKPEALFGIEPLPSLVVTHHPGVLLRRQRLEPLVAADKLLTALRRKFVEAAVCAAQLLALRFRHLL